MSTSLTLVIDQYGARRDSILGFNRLRLNWQNYEAFDKIKAEAIPLPISMDWYGDEGLELRRDDEYGDPLTYMAAYSLARHLSEAALTEWDSAVLEFLKRISPDTKIVLCWS